jgi:2,3-bisphosphoglycerate-dependent phosphoglycerate mutase
MILPLIKIIFLRHGNTFESTDIPVQVGAKTNLPLTLKGREQAEKVSGYLAQNRLVPDHIYTGPLLRHLETADILASHFNVPVIQAAALNELDYGQWEGKSVEELSSKWPDSYQAWCEQAIWPKDIFDPKQDLFTHQLALKSWLDELAHNTEPTSTVLAITSNGLLKILLTLIPDLALSLFEHHSFDDYKVKTGHFCVVEYDMFAKKLFIKNWNVGP